MVNAIFGYFATTLVVARNFRIKIGDAQTGKQMIISVVLLSVLCLNSLVVFQVSSNCLFRLGLDASVEGTGVSFI